MDLFTTQSSGILEMIIVATAIIVGIVYIFSSIRRQDLQVLRSSNDDLRASITDKTGEINTLTAHVAILETQMGNLQLKVVALEKQNGDLQSLVKEALLAYFQHNPEIAKNMQEPAATS